MPVRNPETGKQIGGAEKQRRKRASADPVDFAEIFQSHRHPPIGNPIDAMLWCNDTLLLCVDALMHLRVLSQADLTRIRMIMDGCAKAGMIRDKSAESKAMLASLKDDESKSALSGLEPYDHSRANSPPIPRPPRRTGTA